MYPKTFKELESCVCGNVRRAFTFFQAKFCRNMSKSRELLSQMMQSGYEGDAQMWLEYVQLER